ncbi:NAD(P)H-binding protein [Paenibacillus sp. JX-17]|uniref:NAD(P)H-binding protein n=1 Tax=Paenibacillus lacisoli TaxID=3064525 RepID=A0ABT9CCG0_9BACL|nr:NAD(P)H-binding protein [Paenibacillus sp. JX-17]MDO7906949.1 NAD(P)H-binding protein [Paenibacillus sp. JX-17]
MKILVTGATGHLGSLVVEALLKKAPAADLAVSVRNPEKAAYLEAQGVDVRYGDFTRPETLTAAFAGIDRLLLISSDSGNRIDMHQAAVTAARQAGVRFIAYTSLNHAPESTLSLGVDHRATEEAILKSGIPYSFLRNNWYVENEAGTILAAAQGAPWVHANGSAKIGWAARADYAQAAAAVIAGQGHENTIYELSGPLRTQADLAAITGEVLSRDIPVQNVDDAAYANMLRGAGLPEATVDMVVGMQEAIREGALAYESSTMEQLLGRPLLPLREVIQSIIGK